MRYDCCWPIAASQGKYDLRLVAQAGADTLAKMALSGP
jgi:flavoprotein